jgi:hypothetical protein
MYSYNLFRFVGPSRFGEHLHQLVAQRRRSQRIRPTDQLAVDGNVADLGRHALGHNCTCFTKRALDLHYLAALERLHEFLLLVGPRRDLVPLVRKARRPRRGLGR